MGETGNHRAVLTVFTGDTAEFELVDSGECAKIVFTGPDDERLNQIRFFSSTPDPVGTIVTLNIGAFGSVLNVW